MSGAVCPSAHAALRCGFRWPQEHCPQSSLSHSDGERLVFLVTCAGDAGHSLSRSPAASSCQRLRIPSEAGTARSEEGGESMRDNAAVAMKPVKEPVPFRSATVDDISEHFNEIYEAKAERAFELYADGGYVPGHDLEHWFQAESELLHPLNTEIVVQDKQVVVRVEVPGFEAKDLDVRLAPMELIISGKREAGDECKETGKTICAECSTRRICRVIQLPLAVDPAKVEATVKDGIL